MHTFRGRNFEIGGDSAPEPEEVALTLARIPRWAGATLVPWSVLQHSIAAFRLAESMGLDDTTQLAALWHDAEEMATGDIPKPFKTAEQSQLQDALHQWMYKKVLRMPYPSQGVRGVVKGIDIELKKAEAHCYCHPLMRMDEEFLNPTLEPIDTCWNLQGAPEHILVQEFVEATERLTKGRQLRR